MCELFAMSSRWPTSVSFSLQRLARHGGAEGPHDDGWGVAFYAGRDALLLREAAAASESDLARHLEHHAPPSDRVISHLRLASLGERTLANTQPFIRELGGHQHVFAHNGDLEDVRQRLPVKHSRYAPVGETDSEWAFCRLMDDLADAWQRHSATAPPLEERLYLVGSYAEAMRALGPANFIYSDGVTLFVHADRRIDTDGQTPLPGLYLLTRDCDEQVPDLTASGIGLRTARQALTLVASVPLTDEPWHVMSRGEVIAIEQGRVVHD